MRSQIVKNLMVWILIILMCVYFYTFFKNQGDQVEELSFSQFMEMVEDGGVDKATLRGDFIQGQITGTLSDGREFKTYGLIDGDVYAALKAEGVEVSYEEDTDSPFFTVLVNILPLILIVGLLIFFMRQMQASGGKAMSFGKSRAKLLTENQNRVTFDDVAGVDEAKEELEEIIAFLKDPKKFARLGGRIPKGVLLVGAPGMGKTLLARAIAGEAGVPFFNISGSEFVEMFVGVGASRVRDLFVQGKKHAPCIIFIDEIDAVGRWRGAGLGGGHDEREQTLNQLLVEMDGFEGNEGVILIAATNRPDVLDPALLRPGRFDRRVIVPRPDVKGREGILHVHTQKTVIGPDVDLSVIARGTPGFSGADLANLVNEAALLAARMDREFVMMTDFEAAKDKVLMGAERKSMIISDDEKRTTAYHEAGHTIVARLIPEADPVHKVTIIPRGMALGLTQQLPEIDKYNMSRTHATNDIAILMGGRAAEEIALNEQTTGAGNDLERATELARKMVCEWGMSDKLGPLAFGKKEEQVFLGREIAQHQDYSEATAVEIDTEVKRIVMDGYQRAKNMLVENRTVLEAMAVALLERETLDKHEIDLLIEGKPLPPMKKEATPTPKPEHTDGRPEKVKDEEPTPEGGGVLPEPSLA